MNGIGDFAWFYSALAQVSAAIVGLVGAVLGSRIIDHYATMRHERHELEARIATGYKQIMDGIAYFPRFRNHLVEQIAQDQEAIEGGLTERQIPPFTDLRWSGSVMVPQSSRISVPEHKAAMERDLRALDALAPAYIPLTARINESAIMGFVARLRDYASTSLHDESKTVALGDAQLLESLASRVSTFHGKFLPGSFFIVIPLLFFVEITGILWPLDALPGMPSHPKPWMLRSLFVGLTGLILYLSYLWWSLGQLYRLRWPTQ